MNSQDPYSDPMGTLSGAIKQHENIAVDTYRVHAIAMPLVRLMRDGNLSWADKEEIAGVIRDVMREAQSMRNEQRHAAQQVGGGMVGGMR